MYVTYSISGKQNFDDSKTLDFSKFNEETIRMYLDAIHNIDIPEEKLDFEQLLKLIRFIVADGKTGN